PGLPGGAACHHLVLDNSLGGTTELTLNADLAVNGDLVLGPAGAASIDAAGHTITVGGNWTVGPFGAFTAGGGAVVLTTADTGSALVTPEGSGFHDFAVDAGAGSVILQGGLTVSGDLTISSGTLDANDQTLTVSGNWSNVSGSF